MRKFVTYLFIIVFLASCSTDDSSESAQCNLLNFKAAQLYYDYFDRQDLGLRTGFSPDFNGIQLEYDGQNRINTVTGGPMLVPAGSNLSEWVLSNSIVYNVDYSGNSITITSAIESFYGDTTNDYTIVNGKIIERSIIIPNGLLKEKINFSYNYVDNTILEFKNGDLFRTFYIENNNLTRVEEFIYFDINNPLEQTDILYAKYEIVFSEFDNLPNLLKGKFFIDGGFFKSFSDNNYHRVTLDYYLYNQETEEFEPESVDMNWRSYNFGVNEDGSSGLFQTDCLD